ncbi:MAG TPA: ABC transporter ATP-binding protein, partial [Caulifigura sp.]|nr:ABC transporter ATP-binding protein [Caulifigura sp.]
HNGRIALTASMEEIHDNHRRVTLRFDEAMTQAPTLVGSLSATGGGAEWTYVCGGDSTQLRRAAEALGARVVDDAALSLDEVFLTRVLN